MKKNLFISGLMLMAALTLTNCAKQEVLVESNDIDTPATQAVEEPVAPAGVPFELTVGIDTKTSTTDASTINWSDADSLNVFHAVAGSDTYSDNDKFTLTSGSTFNGTLQNGALTEESYDWYVLYPYNSKILTPDNTTAGYLGLGSSGISVNQKQTGNGSKAHLAGRYFPLYGKATSVAAGTTPSITLKQALAVIRVRVKNANTEPLTVTAVSFSAPENIVGTYFLDITGETPVFTKSGDKYVSNVANLTVNGGTAIAQNETADFYIAVKPFTAEIGDELTITVNGYEKSVNVSKAAVAFEAGKISTVGFTYDYVSGTPEPTTKNGFYRVESASWLSAGDRVIIAANGSNVALSTTQNSNNRGQVSVTKAADGDYSTLSSYTDAQEFILEEGTQSGSFGFWCDNGEQANKYIYAASSSANQLKSQIDLDDNASFTIAIDGDGNATVTAQGTNSRNLLKYNDSNSIFSCYGSGQKPVAIYKYYGGSTPTCATPVIAIDKDNKVSITSATAGATLYYTVDGTTPDSGSTKYTAPFSIDATTTVKAIAIRSHYNNSAVASEELIPAAPAPVITVTSDNPMAVSNENDLYEIEYTITNPADGVSIAAVADVDWIHDFDYSVDGEVIFEVDAQAAAAAARSGIITLSYTGAADFEVTVNQAAGAGAVVTKTSTLTFAAACGGSGTADDGAEWTVSSDGSESAFDKTKGIHYGTGSAAVQYITLTTSGIPGTISKVVVNASTASSVSATVSVTVGGDAFGGDPQTLTTSAAEYTFNGSASGEIVVTVTKPESAYKALYVKSIAVTYTD